MRESSVKSGKSYVDKLVTLKSLALSLSNTSSESSSELVERLPALHYSVDFIFLSFGIVGLIVEL